ncbi:uncharacterized protein Z520_04765 [Fonsecaea multimorphosa CBS 102226]|uniref:Probable E3 ubiquitin ligase complex SCF subunit sconB n=1 Tax=Fonsecaea multimorphosa CBS 102226 TaxID=1442371 RepID=A0A0D2K7N7_9EURO|nr:uncharacterized protein Z520_04765 [Fonsecaea multimorphosa CBS 102226]KIX99189.1 hypothetical protein Z520_04765 [Fonsecaea multimorphosa CBS 102226]OAL25886.1 hypothetical protein AYO22_04513 [Fonsecaea multimorphosa]
MPKRRRSEDDIGKQPAPAKRSRTGSKRNLLDISDEILLRILSFLPIKDLLKTECVSRRLNSLATDRGIWKVKYMQTWVRPRSRRIPSAGPGRQDHSVDWKSQFRIKSNWAKGQAKVKEVEVARPPAPPVIAKVHRGMIYTVDPATGLRVWSQRDVMKTPRAQIWLHATSAATCMAVETIDDTAYISLGFDDGSLAIYLYNYRGQFEHRFSHQSADGPLVAISLAFPYVMTVSRTKYLSLYQWDLRGIRAGDATHISTIARLQSDASFAPVSVSLRHAPSQVIATIAYAFSRFQSGWCIGLQEIRLSTAGRLVDSRLASTIGPPYTGWSKGDMTTRSTSSLPLPLHPQLMKPPTSLSYQHPFLIGTLADNTIISFLVTSNDEKLEISAARRLWGHTSAVSGAEVNNRGKAVSISSRGDEMRVWDLEPVMTAESQPRASTRITAVDALPGSAGLLARRGPGLQSALGEVRRELELIRQWVGFDDEQVVVLGERDQRQIMALYDFT